MSLWNNDIFRLHTPFLSCFVRRLWARPKSPWAFSFNAEQYLLSFPPHEEEITDTERGRLSAFMPVRRRLPAVGDESHAADADARRPPGDDKGG